MIPYGTIPILPGFHADIWHLTATPFRSVQLINIQDNNEFASHQLNRDTWSDDNLQSVLSGSFVFWQVRPSPIADSRGAPSHCKDMRASAHEAAYSMCDMNVSNVRRAMSLMGRLDSWKARA